MREYKFRGIPLKVKYDNNKPYDPFLYGDLEIDYNYGGGTKYYISFEQYGSLAYRERCEVSKESVGQYIGLKDKNGKEIYEGDKLKVVNHSILIGDGTSNMSYETRIYEIVFHDYEFMGKLVQYGLPKLKDVEDMGQPIYHHLFDNGEDTEVIGNIHDKDRELNE